ncbi:MAG TPA: sugar kinase [Streptosporangiaceae bacterium]|jgi:sugar/nucleoside kinase (ribokinase family)
MLSQHEGAPSGAAQANGQGLDLVVIGDCNPDVLVLGHDVTPEFGQQEKLVDSMSLVIGGSAAITAVAAARLGLSVALVATVGADPAGQFMLDQLAREGVRTDAVTVRDDVPTGMTVALSRGGDRAILTALGAVAALTAAYVPDGLLARARHVHASSYFLLERSLGPGLAEVFADARATGVTTSLDTNWDPAGKWGDGRLTAAISQTGLLLPNEAEALHLSGQPDLAGAARALTAGGATLVVKRGEHGALCVEGGTQHQVSLPPVTPVDATGAGDCFNAGLIAGLLGGRDLTGAVALGCAAGALSTRAPGGTAGCPDLATAAALAEAAAITDAAQAGLAARG